MNLTNNPKYADILVYLKEVIDILTYSEIMDMVFVKFGYRFTRQETLIYHLNKHGIKKSGSKKYRVKNIKGLRKIFEAELFRLNKLRESVDI